MPVPLCLEQFATRPTVHRLHRCFCGDLRQEYHEQLVIERKQVLKWVPRNDAWMTFPGHKSPTIASARRGVIDDVALRVESLVLAAGS